MREAIEAIEELARKCARRDLRLRDAQALFLALYVADVLGASQGNTTHAAELAGVNREALLRIRRRMERHEGESASSKEES